jgi:hypothetical protein
MSMRPRTFRSESATPAVDWPSLVESGAGLSEAERSAPDPMSAPIERMPPEPFSLKAEIRKNPGLYVGIGALAAVGLAAFLGRRPILRAARPIVLRVIASHPAAAVRLAARNPRAAARVVRAFR